MVEIKDKLKCCGCGACVQACSKKCISFKEDEEGFLYPVVNVQQCIHCNRCTTVCPIQNHREVEGHHLKAYAAYATEEKIREKSSSGGIFSLVANCVLEEKGVVFGAAFDEENMVHHIAVDRKEDLFKLRGSKYLQSRIGDTYRMAEEFLKEGKTVLFTGTACQVAGLKGYLGKEYERLILMDILCHGVPSPKVWKKYLQCQEKSIGEKITSINFRNKDYGWKQYCMCLNFTNDKIYKQKFMEDNYMKLFLSNLCLRPSCYDCQFKDLPRQSDISIGDCWGLEKVFPEMDDDIGASVVILHSKKGEEIFSLISSDTKNIERDIDLLLPPSADSRKSVQKPMKREAFFIGLNGQKDISSLTKLTEPSFVEKIERKIKRYISWG